MAQAPTSKCPVAHHSANLAGTCPVDHNQLKDNGHVESLQSHTGTKSAHSPAACPFGHGSPGPTSSPRAAEQAKAGGRCPFGYDSTSAKPALTPLHCVLCSSLLFDCVAARPCDHRYCRECISRFQDCPLCGRDIESLRPDTACQATVDEFTGKHARQPEHKNAPETQVGTSASATDMQLNTTDPAAFFLELGLTSLAGRNFSAGLARLEQCKQLLLVSSAAEGGAADYAKLGAVCGSQGDCCRQLQNLPGAARHYQESIQHLQQASRSNDEAQHALSVSLNKLGDLHYRRGDLASARGCYHEAFRVRDELLHRSCDGEGSQTPTQAYTALAVDLCVSLGKLVDVDKVLGNVDAAAQQHAKAAALLSQVASGIGSCDGTVRSKYEAVAKLLESSP